MRCFREARDGLGCHRLFVAQAEPVIAGIRFASVRQFGTPAVSDVKEIAEHVDRVALLPIAEEFGNGDAQILPQEVEQSSLETRDGVDRDPKVERLLAARARIAIRETRPHIVEGPVKAADRSPDDEPAGIFERLADPFTSGHFADSGMTCAILHQDDVAREERAVCAAQVHQHTVVAGHGNDLQFGNDRGTAMHCTHIG
jgi:hypothetical protein